MRIPRRLLTYLSALMLMFGLVAGSVSTIAAEADPESTETTTAESTEVDEPTQESTETASETPTETATEPAEQTETATETATETETAEETETPTETATETATETEEATSVFTTLQAEESTVTIYLRSANPAIASQLPANATWTVSQGDTVIASKTFAAEHRDLSTEKVIPVQDPIPYGTYQIAVSAGPAFQPYSRSVTLENPTEDILITLQPVTVANVTINIASAQPAFANAMPAGSTWTVSDGTNTMSGEFDGAQLALPSSITVDNPVPFGTYTIEIDAGPTFQVYTAQVVINEPSETVNVVLSLTSANVTIYLSSANPAIASQLPADASWSVSRGSVEYGDTFAAQHRNLSTTQVIPVASAVPYGTYQVSVDAGPTFLPYSRTVTLENPNEDIIIVLQPRQSTYVTIEISSANALVTRMPEGSTWSVSKGGTEIDSGTFLPAHLQLPVTIEVDDPVPFGTYTIEIDASPAFEPYTADVTLDQQSQTVEVVLEPSENAIIDQIVQAIIRIIREILEQAGS